MTFVSFPLLLFPFFLWDYWRWVKTWYVWPWQYISALSWDAVPPWLLGHGSCSLRHAAYFCWFTVAITNTHANMAGDPCWDCIWTSLVSAPSGNTGSEFAPEGQAGRQHIGVGTCGQFMCVTETWAHTGLVHCASANFSSDINSECCCYRESSYGLFKRLWHIN